MILKCVKIRFDMLSILIKLILLLTKEFGVEKLIYYFITISMNIKRLSEKV